MDDWILASLGGILYQINDEADHIIGTDADNHKEVAIIDAKSIKALVNEAMEKINAELEKEAS